MKPVLRYHCCLLSESPFDSKHGWLCYQRVYLIVCPKWQVHLYCGLDMYQWYFSHSDLTTLKYTWQVNQWRNINSRVLSSKLKKNAYSHFPFDSDRKNYEIRWSYSPAKFSYSGTDKILLYLWNCFATLLYTFLINECTILKSLILVMSNTMPSIEKTSYIVGFLHGLDPSRANRGRDLGKWQSKWIWSIFDFLPRGSINISNPISELYVPIRICL